MRTKSALSKTGRFLSKTESLGVGPFLGRHSVGVWLGGVWNGHFPESEKYFSEAEISRKMPEIPLKERFCQISGSEI